MQFGQLFWRFTGSFEVSSQYCEMVQNTEAVLVLSLTSLKHLFWWTARLFNWNIFVSGHLGLLILGKAYLAYSDEQKRYQVVVGVLRLSTNASSHL